MDVRDTDLPGVKILTPIRHGDERGFFSETFRADVLVGAGIDQPFVQDNHSLSAAVGVVRGLHWQTPPFAQDKLVRVVRGAVRDVAVDIRRGSPTFGRHVAVELSRDNWRQLLVPVGFAHGYVTLEPDTEVQYKVTRHYDPASERGIRWDDPVLSIDWGIAAADATLSDRDRKHPALADAADLF